jgi:hypothetical protein
MEIGALDSAPFSFVNRMLQGEKMFSKKIVSSLLFIFAAAFSAQSQTGDGNGWSVADYLKNLPEIYKTFHGDFSSPSKERTVIDEQRGYAAYLNSPPHSNPDNPPFPIFEMALFKSQIKPPLLVVSNMKNDHVCTNYETFFLVQIDRKWAVVKRDVLPPLDLKMFWNKPQTAARFLKIVERDNATSYHFELPRQGTRIKVSLEICDQFLEVTPIGQVEELEKIIESVKPIYLEWDKQKGKFKFAK